MVIFFYQDSIEIEKIKDVLKKKNLLSSLGNYHSKSHFWRFFSIRKKIVHCVTFKSVRILIRDRPVFFKPLFEAKITRIKQFLKEDNTFLSMDELISKVDISIPFTLYYGLVAAIPTEWKNILKQHTART